MKLIQSKCYFASEWKVLIGIQEMVLKDVLQTWENLSGGWACGWGSKKCFLFFDHFGFCDIIWQTFFRICPVFRDAIPLWVGSYVHLSIMMGRWFLGPQKIVLSPRAFIHPLFTYSFNFLKNFLHIHHTWGFIVPLPNNFTLYIG
jgi:hypothetical protein